MVVGWEVVMVQEKYGVRLATQEKGRLRKMIRAGRSSAQAITRARILLKIDEGWPAPQVAAALDVSERTVFRTKRRYAEEGLDEVLRHHNQVNRPRKVDERVEAHLIALACSPVPDGHDHWTMRALAGKVVELGLVEVFNVNYFCRLASIILAGSPPYPAPAAGPLRSGSWGR